MHSLLVVLDHDIRDDDVQPLIDAIGCLRHVARVVPAVSDTASMMAEVRAKDAVRERLLQLLHELRG